MYTHHAHLFTRVEVDQLNRISDYTAGSISASVSVVYHYQLLVWHAPLTSLLAVATVIGLVNVDTARGHCMMVKLLLGVGGGVGNWLT